MSLLTGTARPCGRQPSIWEHRPVLRRTADPRPLKHMRYAERSMTIGIGVLGCSSPGLIGGERPDSIVMIADTMGSTELDSTDELRKIHSVSEAKFCAVCAGNM